MIIELPLVAGPTQPDFDSFLVEYRGVSDTLWRSVSVPYTIGARINLPLPSGLPTGSYVVRVRAEDSKNGHTSEFSQVWYIYIGKSVY